MSVPGSLSASVDASDIDLLWARTRVEHQEALDGTFRTLGGVFTQWVAAARQTLGGSGRIFFFGNGGSAADAQHLATELTVRYARNRPAMAAMALTTDSSALTAIGNDLGFDQIFARQIEALGRPGDMVVGISTSGASPNCLAALKTARAGKMVTVGLLGKGGGAMAPLCDIPLIVPSTVTGRIQEMHITLGHMFCEALEMERC